MKPLLSAMLIGGAGAASMVWIFNNADKINPNRFISTTEIAALSGGVAGVTYLALNAAKVA